MRKVEVKGLSKSYDGQSFVLRSIDVTVEPGEFFVLVGPSGCGKSTMLRMLAGLESISDGQLFLDNQLANHLRPSERALSMVFQNYALYPHLTVEENILFGLHTKKISKEEQRNRRTEACDMLGLTDYLHRKPRELSGGQRQRVALARAVVTHAPLCLMDEPLSNLDAKLRAKMRSEIRQLQRKLGITMIYVTHDQTEAMTMADRMMILSDGEVQQVGRPLDVYNSPDNTFVASFIGSPPMNLIGATCKDNMLLVGNQWIAPLNDTLASLITQTDVIIGVRPEHILPATDSDLGFRVTIVNVEVLGTETLLTFDFGSQKQWIAKWHGQHHLQPGDAIDIVIEDEHLVLFSADSGQRIRTTPLSQPVEVGL